MYFGKIIFSQIIDHLPMHTFRRCVNRYHGHYKVKHFSCWDQYLCMVFAQLTYRESLRDIQACLRAQQSKLYHIGIRAKVSRNTLANANKVRDWRIYADLAQSLIHMARRLYSHEDFGVQLDETVYALDATTIDLCLSVFPWAHFRQTKAAIKLHTLLDLRGNIPTFIHISDGKLHDVNVLDKLLPEPGAFYIMDRGYLDFERLHTLSSFSAFFVIRAKSNLKFRRLYSHPIDKTTGLRCDQTIVLTGFYPYKRYPAKLRRVKYYDSETHKFVFLNFILPALSRNCTSVEGRTLLQMDQAAPANQGFPYHQRRQEVWIPSVYVLVAIIRKRLLDLSLYTILQSVTIFEKTLLQVLTDSALANRLPVTN